MMTRNFLLSSALALAAFAGLAMSPALAGQSSGSFAAIDRNNDGVVDDYEIEAMVATVFADLDADGDGVLRGAEIGALEKYPGFSGKFPSSVTFKTLLGQVRADVRAADRNRNGVLTGG